MLTKHLEAEISFEKVTMSWSHGYTREGILGGKGSVGEKAERRESKGCLWEQRLVWDDLPKHRKPEKAYGDKDRLQRKETCTRTEKLNPRLLTW